MQHEQRCCQVFFFFILTAIRKVCDIAAYATTTILHNSVLHFSHFKCWDSKLYLKMHLFNVKNALWHSDETNRRNSKCKRSPTRIPCWKQSWLVNRSRAHTHTLHWQMLVFFAYIPVKGVLVMFAWLHIGDLLQLGKQTGTKIFSIEILLKTCH